MSADELMAALPFARRYARALTGTQRDGDMLVAATLRDLPPGLPARHALYAGISRRAPDMEDGAGLSPVSRRMLLLTALEGMDESDAAGILDLDAPTAAARLAEARAALRAATATDVLIIEDEPIIAMDLRLLVERCGHRVAGVAASETEAVSLARKRPPGLVLADINLGRGGSGIAAVRRILEESRVPVIFVTAYPEMLLTAEGVEPTYVMRKPFDPMTLAVFAWQAVSAGRVPLS
ncbi:response regulator [Leptolyngbya sp. 15MV]|nr:response regulator [Leptolyngbya sp. 15MV]